jgi:hypothetical protein
LPTARVATALNQPFGFGVVTNARAFIIYVSLMAVIVGAEYVWENNRLRNQAENFRTPIASTIQSSLPNPKSSH